MDQLIFASLSHTYYWYEVGILKVSVVIYTVNSLYRVRAVLNGPIFSSKLKQIGAKKFGA